MINSKVRSQLLLMYFDHISSDIIKDIKNIKNWGQFKGVGEATAPAIAPYLHPCRQQMRIICH